jgi:fimbrial isopeptide formation D2 family protein/uncharacterized repeat protein (TIGR01451 family)
MQVFALDPPGSTAGPATKVGSGSGDSGSGGFYAHRRGGAWSSWVNVDHALKVDSDFSFRPFKVNNADDYGPATTITNFGNDTPDSYDDAIEDNEDLSGEDRGTDSDSSWGYKVRGSGKVEAGSFGVTIKNARIQAIGKVAPNLIDVKITCTDYTVDDDIYSGYTPYIGIEKRNIIPNIILLGVKEATFKYEYFKAGTTTPYDLATNMTYADIDDHQYVAINNDELSDGGGVFLDPGTMLDYGYESGSHIAYSDYDTQSGSNWLTAFGAAYRSGTNGVLLTFGNMESSVASSAGEVQKRHAFDYAWFAGGTYNMWDPTPPDPYKTVADSDESAVDDKKENTLRDSRESFVYYVNQQIPSGIYSTCYWSSFVMKDQIPKGLIVDTVRVYQDRRGDVSVKGAWSRTGGVTNSDWFDIDVSDGGLVTASAHDDIIGSAYFYGGDGRPDTRIFMRIEVRWDPAMTDAQKEALGYSITVPTRGWSVSNRATVNIKNKVDKPFVDRAETTNSVKTNVFLPEKKVTDGDETLTEYNVLCGTSEPFIYSVTQYVTAKTDKDLKYKSFVLSDTVDSCLSLGSVKVLRDGVDVTSQFTNSSSGHSIVMSAKAASLGSLSFYGHRYTLHIPVMWDPGMTDEEKVAHGHRITSPSKGWRVTNTGSVSVDGSSVSTNRVTTDVFAPEKKVFDSDEFTGGSNTLYDSLEEFTYEISQFAPLISGGSITYTDMTFIDPIDEYLQIAGVRMLRDDGADVTDHFISGTVGNNVVMAAREEALADLTFYGRIYTMRITVKWDPDVTDAQKEAGGYRIDDPATGWRVKNRGLVTINGVNNDSSEVFTDVFPPLKKVTDQDESLKGGNALTNAIEPYYYSVFQHVPAKTDSNIKYTGLTFTDAIDECLTVTDIAVFREDGEDVTELFTDGTDGNDVSLTAKEDSLVQSSFYGHTYELRIGVELIIDLSESELRRHGHYVDADMNLKYDNKARVRINDRNYVDTGTVTTIVPVPDLQISKRADKYEYQAKEIIHYTVVVSHTDSSNGDAAKVHIWDDDLPKTDMTLSSFKVNGISAPIEDGDVAGISGKVTFRQIPGGFDFKSTLLREGEVATITFDAAPQTRFTGTNDNYSTNQHPHNGEIIDNTAWVSAFSDTSGDFTNPKPVSASVYINSPVAGITKTTDARKYKTRQAVKYTLEVKDTNAGTYGNDIVITDKVRSPGMKIKFDGTFIMQYPASYDATGRITKWNYVTYNELRERGMIESDVEETGFTIDTRLNLGYDIKVPPTDRGKSGYSKSDLDLVTVIYVHYETQDIPEDFLYEFLENRAEASFSGKNKNDDDIENDITVPSGLTYMEKITEILPDGIPLLNIDKKASEPRVIPGEELYYELDVTVGYDHVYDVVIEDMYDISPYNASIDLNSIVVKKEGKDITSSCRITPIKYEVAHGGEKRTKGFTIETNTSLAPEEHIKVEYRVDVPDAATQLRRIMNIATTSAIDAEDRPVEPDEDNESVDILIKPTIINVEKLAGRSITKTKDDDGDPYYLRQEIPYRIKVTNTTQNPAQNIIVVDNIDHSRIFLDISSLKVVYSIPGKDPVDITQRSHFIWGVDDGRFDNAFQSDDRDKDFTIIVDPSIVLQTAESIIVTYNVYADYHFKDGNAEAPDFLPRADYVNNVAAALASNAEPKDDDGKVLVDPSTTLGIVKSADKMIYAMGDTVKYSVRVTNAGINNAVSVHLKDAGLTSGAVFVKGSIKVYFDSDGGDRADAKDITDACYITEITPMAFHIATNSDLAKGGIETIWVDYQVKLDAATIGEINNIAIAYGENAREVCDEVVSLIAPPLLSETAEPPQGMPDAPQAIPPQEISPPASPVPPQSIVVNASSQAIAIVASSPQAVAIAASDGKSRIPARKIRGRGVPDTGDDFDPLAAALIMGCTGGLTFVMLIRRRQM